MGFGHRVYKNYDPRADIIKKNVDEVFEVTGKNPKLEIAVELEKRALDDEYFVERKLYPNVDFYSGLIYEALNLPPDMFTVMFAIPRTSGWMAQWLEMVQDEETKIARPRQIYTGERERDYEPVDEARAEGRDAQHRGLHLDDRSRGLTEQTRAAAAAELVAHALLEDDLLAELQPARRPGSRGTSGRARGPRAPRRRRPEPSARAVRRRRRRSARRPSSSPSRRPSR